MVERTAQRAVVAHANDREADKENEGGGVGRRGRSGK